MKRRKACSQHTNNDTELTSTSRPSYTTRSLVMPLASWLYLVLIGCGETRTCHGRSYIEARGGNCLLVIWPVILHVTRSHKITKDVVTIRVFDSPNAFGGRALPRLTREAWVQPRPPSRIWGKGPTFKRREKERGMKGREKRKGGNGSGCLVFI